jgi:hypothetical protein
MSVSLATAKLQPKFVEYGKAQHTSHTASAAQAQEQDSSGKGRTGKTSTKSSSRPSHRRGLIDLRPQKSFFFACRYNTYHPVMTN